jgi:hypothetical protein
MDFKSVLAAVVGKSENSSRGEQYLAVKISKSEVLATLWSVISGQVTVGSAGGEKIESDDFSSLLSAADTAISAALGPVSLPAAKTIFGVNPDWIEDGKIVDEKLHLLKSLCKELDLRPLGYVLLSEALENYLTEVEGAPLTAILISLDGDCGWVSMFRAGKNLGTVPLACGEKGWDNLTGGIEKALRQFTQVEVFPARIILHDGRADLKVCEEKIMAHPWTKQLPFLHFPKVEVLPGEMVVKAVAAATGTQMGGRIEIGSVEERSEEVEEAEEEISKEVLPVERVGEETASAELEEISAADAGFVFDDGKTTIEEIKQTPEPTAEIKKVTLPSIKIPKINFSGVSDRLKNIFGRIKFPANLNGKPPKVIFTVAVGTLGLVILLGVGLYFLPKAKLIVHLTPQPFNRELVATISGQTVDITEIGNKKGVVTGQKMVGEKAKGTVTIYGATSAKTFPAGTTLTSSDGLKFTLDQEISLASASDFLSPATAMGKITAADIGDKYNLAPSTKFSLGNSALYLAKNDSTLTGGSSHEATVVTKLDQDRLVATLSAELAQKAQADLNAKLSSGQTLLPNAITATISKKRFSKDIDAEADMLSVDLTIEYKGVTVSQTDLMARFKEKYGGEIPAGYVLVEEISRPEIKSTKLDKNGNVVIDARLNGVTLPQFDSSGVVSKISGKNPLEASEIIKSQMGVSQVQIVATPKLFQFVIDKFLPWKAENISIETVSD